MKTKKPPLSITSDFSVIQNKGFTLIELIVVMALISILLFFSVPRLDIDLFSDDDRNLSTWILMTAKALKEKSQESGVRLILYVDMDNDVMWTGQKPDADAKEAAPKENQYKVPDGMQVLDVEFPGMEKKSSGIAEIYFYPKGYSDKSVIHVQDKDHNRNSYVIEPFLTEVKIHDSYVEF